MIRLIVWLILISLVLRSLVRLGRGIAEGLQGPKPPKAVPLVRDPVCGTFVAPGESFAFRTGGETHYFCSVECRERFRKSA